MQHIECPGPLALLCRGCYLVEDGACKPLHGVIVIGLACLMQPRVYVRYRLLG